MLGLPLLCSVAMKMKRSLNQTELINKPIKYELDYLKSLEVVLIPFLLPLFFACDHLYIGSDESTVTLTGSVLISCRVLCPTRPRLKRVSN